MGSIFVIGLDGIGYGWVQFDSLRFDSSRLDSLGFDSNPFESVWIRLKLGSVRIESIGFELVRTRKRFLAFAGPSRSDAAQVTPMTIVCLPAA